MMCVRLLFATFVVHSVADTFDPTQESLVLLQTQAIKIAQGNISRTSYGNSKCQCVAIQGITGTVAVSINDTNVGHVYPAELGSFCNAWDEGNYPGSCDGDTPEQWCAGSWCYVDPCDCDIDVNPSPSYYLDGATHGGKQIFYSYATCGSKNYFNEPPATKIKAICAKEWDEATYGFEDCPCVGINNLSGFTDVVISTKTVSHLYPADIGSGCSAWDEDKYPGSCDGKGPEGWCSQSWCYVDTENCKVNSTESYYLKNGIFRGNPLHYSYLTCGGSNTFGPDGNSGTDIPTKASATTVGLGSVALAVVMLRGSI